MKYHWAAISKFVLSTFVLIILTLGFLPLTASAANPADTSLHLTISPPIINIDAQPGDTATTQIRIKNDGVNTEHLQLNIEKFTAIGENGEAQIVAPTPQDAFIKWVTFSQNVFDVTPGEWNTVTATFKIPSDAAFDYYYMVEFVRAAPGATNSPTTSRVSGAISARVLLTVHVPGVVVAAQVADFGTSSFINEFLPVTFNVRVKNTGNVHLAPRGNIFISQDGKTDLAVLEVNQGLGNTLPNSFRVYKSDWSDGFPVYANVLNNGQVVLDSSGTPQQDLNWDFSKANKFRIGQYTAKLLLVYNDGTKDIPLTATATFWVIPWKLITAVILIPLGLIIGLIFLTRWLVLRGASRTKTRSS